MIEFEKRGITDLDKIYLLLKREGYSNIFVAKDKKGTFYPTHTHPFEEVRWVIKGEIVIANRDEKFILKAGDVLITPANTPHWAQVNDDVEYVCASKIE